MKINKTLMALPVVLALFSAGNANADSSSWTEYKVSDSSTSITINEDAKVTFSAGTTDIWSFNNNITPQDSSNILSVIDTQFNLSSGSLTSVGQCDSSCSSTFSSSSAFDYLAVHYGQGELLFKFATPVNTFTIGNLPKSLSNFRAYSDASISAVPEPESYGMLLAGLGLLGFMVRRNK